MKNKLFFFWSILTLICGNSVCGPVNPQTARQTALNQFNQMYPTRGTLSANDLTDVSATLNYSHLYAFNVPSGGFVIVSGDDRTRPVLAYSDEGTLDVATMPPAAKAMIDDYERQLAAIANGAVPVPYVERRDNRTVSPLTTSQWAQSGYGYNALCPVDSACPSSMDYRSATGCGATALAQYMRYWQFPTNGIGSNCYSYNDWIHGTLCADFANTTYDYANMPNSLTNSSTAEQVNAVATLQYHAGVAMNMYYSEYGSDCGMTYALLPYPFYNYYAAVRHFGYSPKAMEVFRNDYTTEEWMDMLKEELDNNRPVLYSGKGGIGGHVFIVDGYNLNNMFHINWGWGWGGGYYTIDHFGDSQYQWEFSERQAATLGLYPVPAEQWCFTDLLDNLYINNLMYSSGQEMTNMQYRFTNIGNAIDTFYLCFAVLNRSDNSFVKWIDCCRQTIAPGDTVDYRLNYTVDVPGGNYILATFRSNDSIDFNATNTRGAMCFPTAKQFYAPFTVLGAGCPTYTNLVIFVRFQDDEEIDHPFHLIDSMFNDQQEGSISAYNYFRESYFNLLAPRSIYARQIVNDSIHSYVIPHPRNYFYPYSNENPIGYHDHSEMINRTDDFYFALGHYLDSTNAVSQEEVLDTRYAGEIDHVTLIFKGEYDAAIDSIDMHRYVLPLTDDYATLRPSINGKNISERHFLFEGADEEHFSVKASLHCLHHYGLEGCSEMYHRDNYLDVQPTGPWDVMSKEAHLCQTSAMQKYYYMESTRAPQQITEDGTYTLYSNATHWHQNSYYIKSSIDHSQWFTFEYRNQEDVYDSEIPGTGMIIGRWQSGIAFWQGWYSNYFFDNEETTHIYWIFRPDSEDDITNGDIDNAYFSAASGRTEFGPTTNPYPYLHHGIPENSFEITDIQEQGDSLTFHVHFLPTAISDNESKNEGAGISIYPTPAQSVCFIDSEKEISNGQVQVFDIFGKLLHSQKLDGTVTPVNISNLSPGIYLFRVTNGEKIVAVKKIMKN